MKMKSYVYCCSFFLFWVGIISFSSCAKKINVSSDSKPISHATWDSLLQKHVVDGHVNYQGFQADSLSFYHYINLLSANHPNEKHWAEKERLAYWINAYNAFTIQLVIENYPVKGIKEIKKGIPFVSSVWDIKFIEIENQTYDLNNIEHTILRKHFEEPRIHFAIVCASISCPELLNEAYVAERIDHQLNNQAIQFINDTSRNKITKEAISISKIFSWFKGDFTKKESLIDFLNRYSKTKINANADISHLSYDWNLNE